MIRLKLVQDFDYEIPKGTEIMVEGNPYRIVKRYKDTLWVEEIIKPAKNHPWRIPKDE